MEEKQGDIYENGKSIERFNKGYTQRDMHIRYFPWNVQRRYSYEYADRKKKRL